MKQINKEIVPDQLLQVALYIIERDLQSLVDKVDSDTMESDDRRAVCAYAKSLTDLNREIRMSLKEIDNAGDMTDEDIQAELEKLQKGKNAKGSTKASSAE